MNRLLFISGIVVLAAATFLITNTPNTTMAYTCSSSSSTHNKNSQSGVSGSSGSCSSSSSASTGFGRRTTIQASASAPNISLKGSGTSGGFHFSGSGNTQASLSAISFGSSQKEATTSSSSGGAQSSCSSGATKSVGGAFSSSTSSSQPGSCP